MGYPYSIFCLCAFLGPYTLLLIKGYWGPARLFADSLQVWTLRPLVPKQPKPETLSPKKLKRKTLNPKPQTRNPKP